MRRDKQGRFLGRLSFDEQYYMEGFRIAAACVRSNRSWIGDTVSMESVASRIRELRVMQSNLQTGQHENAFNNGQADAYLVAFGFA